MLTKSEVKYIQSLSQKKFREEAGVYMVEGPKIVNEALAAPHLKIDKVYALNEWAATHQHLTKNIPVEIVTDAELERLSQLKTPNQVMAIAQIPVPAAADFKRNELSLALDGIQDPGNLGTIIRIADWFGVKQIVCSTDCADAYNSKVVQATMGSIFRVKLIYIDLPGWMQQLEGGEIYGAALNGSPLAGISKIDKGVIVIGNESKGIRSEVMGLVTKKITIERRGEAESLNAAVATGIILSHLR